MTIPTGVHLFLLNYGPWFLGLFAVAGVWTGAVLLNTVFGRK